MRPSGGRVLGHPIISVANSPAGVAAEQQQEQQHSSKRGKEAKAAEAISPAEARKSRSHSNQG